MEVRHHVLLRLVHHLDFRWRRVELEPAGPFVIVSGTLRLRLQSVVAGASPELTASALSKSCATCCTSACSGRANPWVNSRYFRLGLLWCLSLFSFFSLCSFSLCFLLFRLSSLLCDFLSFFFFFLSSLELLRLELDRLPIIFNDK